MAKRDQVRRFLGGHYPRDAGDAEHVAFLGEALAEELVWSCVGEVNEAACCCGSSCDGFFGDLGHVHGLGRGEVREVGVGGCWKGR